MKLTRFETIELILRKNYLQGYITWIEENGYCTMSNRARRKEIRAINDKLWFIL